MKVLLSMKKIHANIMILGMILGIMYSGISFCAEQNVWNMFGQQEIELLFSGSQVCTEELSVGVRGLLLAQEIVEFNETWGYFELLLQQEILQDKEQLNSIFFALETARKRVRVQYEPDNKNDNTTDSIASLESLCGGIEIATKFVQKQLEITARHIQREFVYTCAEKRAEELTLKLHQIYQELAQDQNLDV